MINEPSPAPPPIAFADFERVDVRVGRILEALPFPEARIPAYRLTIDFGPAIGVKRSSARITTHYALESLPGRLVVAVVNVLPKKIGPVTSEVLVLGVPDERGDVVLLAPDRDGVPLGARMF